MSRSFIDNFFACFSRCPDAACALTPGHRIAAANRAFTERLGLSGEFVGKPLLDLVAPEDRVDVERRLDALSVANEETSFEATCTSLSGTLTFFAWSAWRAEENLIFVLLRDDPRILPTGLGSAAQALRAQEIIETSPTFIVGIDTRGKVVFMNGTMLGALGYTRDEVLGQDYLSMFIPERDQAGLVGVFRNLKAMLGPSFNQNRILTRSGREILVEWHGRPVLGRNGELDYFYGVGIDVTEQKRYREALFKSQQRLALHFQQAPLGMIEWDRDFRVLDWNPAAELIFGWSREEAVGKGGQELVVPEPVRPYVADIWENALQAKGTVQSVNDNITKNGRTIICEWKNTALVDEEGAVVGVSSLVQDVTEQKRAEEDSKNRERTQAATIEQLSAPVIDLWDGVLALPVIGAVDEARAARMMESLLEAIVESGAHFAILDVTGATEINGSMAQHLGNMVRAAGLLGSECIVSGVSPSMARALVELDIAISVRTFGTLRAALRYAIRASRR